MDNVVRQPRIRLTINDIVVTSCEVAEIVSSRTCEASSFHIAISYSDVVRLLGQAWLDETTISVSIDVGLMSSEQNSNVSWIRLITGNVDRISFDIVSGLLSINGRDNAAWLINSSVRDSFLNKTSYEIVTALAKSCGLKTDFDATRAC